MYFKQTNKESLSIAIGQLQVKETEGLFVLLGEKEAPDLFLFQEELQTFNVEFVGGLFPSLIVGNKKYEEGMIVLKIPLSGQPVLVENLSRDEPRWPEIKTFSDDDNISLMVLLDGLSGNVSKFLFELFYLYGNSFNYFGGGAGSLSLIQKPCLFSNKGVFEDAALICPINLKSTLGVKHGWEQVYGPIIATKTNKNIIQELNWEPAFNVYKKVVEDFSDQKLNDENFFDIAKGYPFGLQRLNSEVVVRDPIAVIEDGALICVGEVPENSVLMVLCGEKEKLIAAANLAVQECSTVQGTLKKAMVFDCISRVLFLEEDFEKEITAIQNQVSVSNVESDVIIEGALTLGEISSHGQGTLEFFNKTIVVSLLYEG